MVAARYRLRFTTGVALTARTYGSATYGEGTYGEQASDPVESLHYLMIPWPGGYLSDPSWIFRQGDTIPPFRVQIRSEEEVLNLDSLDIAYLVLTNTDSASVSSSWLFELNVTTIDGVQWLIRPWRPGDLAIPGTYRAAVVLQMDSGRRITIPADDRHQFVINPNNTIPIPPVMPQYKWDAARWNYAYWS